MKQFSIKQGKSLNSTPGKVAKNEAVWESLLVVAPQLEWNLFCFFFLFLISSKGVGFIKRHYGTEMLIAKKMSRMGNPALLIIFLFSDLLN